MRLARRLGYFDHGRDLRAFGTAHACGYGLSWLNLVRISVSVAPGTGERRGAGRGAGVSGGRVCGNFAPVLLLAAGC